jgi:hypothetical protein
VPKIARNKFAIASRTATGKITEQAPSELPNVVSCQKREVRSPYRRNRIHRLAHRTNSPLSNQSKPRIQLFNFVVRSFGADNVAQTVEVIEAGYNVVILDNLRNSSTEALRRIEAIVGKSVPFEHVDLTDIDAVRSVFKKYDIDSVIHFAALKVAVPKCPRR